MMIEAGKKYKSVTGNEVTVTAIYGGRVYYRDSYGCFFYKEAQVFATLYTN